MASDSASRALDEGDPRTAAVKEYLAILHSSGDVEPISLQRERDAALLRALELDGEERQREISRATDLDRAFVEAGSMASEVAARQAVFLDVVDQYSSKHGISSEDWVSMGVPRRLVDNAKLAGP